MEHHLMTDWSTRPQRVVVAAFLHDRGEVLLARRASGKAIAPGKYHLPGGHVEFGEHPEAALVRELHEELGVTTRIAEPLWTFSYVLGTDHTVGIVFRAELLGTREQILWQQDDIEECVWVTEQHLGDHLPADDHNFQAAAVGFARMRSSS